MQEILICKSWQRILMNQDQYRFNISAEKSAIEVYGQSLLIPELASEIQQWVIAIIVFFR